MKANNVKVEINNSNNKSFSINIEYTIKIGFCNISAPIFDLYFSYTHSVVDL